MRARNAEQFPLWDLNPVDCLRVILHIDGHNT